MCPKCGRPKAASQANVGNPFGDLLGGIFEVTFAQLQGRDRVTTTRQRFGKEEVVVYERAGDMIRVLDQKALEKRREVEKESLGKASVPSRDRRSSWPPEPTRPDSSETSATIHTAAIPNPARHPYDRAAPAAI